MEQEMVQPKRTGKRSTVLMQIEVMVEVADSDSYTDMTEQAKDQLRKRILPAKGFHPMRAKSRTVYTGLDVERLKHNTLVPPNESWNRP